MPPLGILLIILVLVAVGIYAWREDQKRREALQSWAASHHARYRRRGIGPLHRKYPGIKLFDRGRSRDTGNSISGEEDGQGFVCTDYKFVTGSGKNRTTHRYGVVIVEAGFPTIPLQIRRENVLDRVGEFLGRDDIDFESAEFSRRFHVASADRKWAFDVIHARTMEYLLQAPAVTIEFGLQGVAVYSAGYNQPSGHEEALQVARKLLALLPDYLVAQMKGMDRK